MCLVLVWEIIEANRYENPVVFLEISVAIDLHEESRFIAERNIHELDITSPVPPQNIYLVMFYG